MVYSVKGNKCKRVWTREFRNPILQIRSFDITGDGLQDIAVLSSGGLHLLQVNYRLVIQKLIRLIENEKSLIAESPPDSSSVHKPTEILPETHHSLDMKTETV